MRDEARILKCPRTHGPLRLVREDLLASDGDLQYPIRDGIALLLPGEISTSSDTIDYYDNFGWVTDEHGITGEAKSSLDTRQAAFSYTRKCIMRLEKYFVGGGDYLLDVGSGPIAHQELMRYHSHFRKRICVDLSMTALRKAKEKLGDRGIYIVGDAANLPIGDETIDAITCNHLIYQLPAELQATATRELWRVLKPGGVAVIVYRWSYSGIAARLEKMAKKLGLGQDGTQAPPKVISAPSRSPDHPQTRNWFEAQEWPFRYSYDCYRLVDNEFMRRFVSDGWGGQLLLSALFTAQVLLPETCGMYGAFPVMVIRKPEAGTGI